MLKVKFKLPTIKREAEMLTTFCKPSDTKWDWSNVVYKNHPELRKTLKNKKPNEFYKYIYTYSNNFIKNNKQDLINSVKIYQKEWDKINNKYFKILSEHFETDYPKNKKTINAYVSIVPIFPRFLDEWGFNVSLKKPEIMLPVSMHEILHFFYFKKWVEVFPKTRREELDFPFLVWKLSEILDPIILNNNKDIQKLLAYKHNNYSEFQKVKIGEKTVVEHFDNLYKNHIKSDESFEKFLKICWDEVKKNKKVIEHSKK